MLNFVEFDDWILLKFLRARKFILPKAIEMFENYMNWRKEMNVDSLIDYKFDCLKNLKKIYPHGYHKTDKFVGKFFPLKFIQIFPLKFFPFNYFIFIKLGKTYLHRNYFKN